MSLKERAYSVLLVSAAENFNLAFTALLPESAYEPVYTVNSISAAKRVLAERSFDFIFVNSPLPDDAGIRFAIDSAACKDTVVLLFAKNDVHDGVHDRVAEYGVFTLPKPTAKPILVQALGWMESARERLRQFEKKNLTLEEKMGEIRLVNRAKWLLISELKMSEPDAHHYIERQAMDCCVSKKEIAENIIKTYS